MIRALVLAAIIASTTTGQPVRGTLTRGDAQQAIDRHIADIHEDPLRLGADDRAGFDDAGRQVLFAYDEERRTLDVLVRVVLFEDGGAMAPTMQEAVRKMAATRYAKSADRIEYLPNSAGPGRHYLAMVATLTSPADVRNIVAITARLGKESNWWLGTGLREASSTIHGRPNGGDDTR
jgi:hypothetical protein